MTEIHEAPAGLDLAAGLENRRGLWLRLVQHGDGWRLSLTAIDGTSRRSTEANVELHGYSHSQAFVAIDGASEWDEYVQGVMLSALPQMLGLGFGHVERSLAELRKGWDRAQRERAERDAGGAKG